MQFKITAIRNIAHFLQISLMLIIPRTVLAMRFILSFSLLPKGVLPDAIKIGRVAS